MSRWRIEIPSRGRDMLLADAGALARVLPDQQDRVVTRAIILMATQTGERTVGELNDRLERIGPEGRRELLNEARVHCGLEPTDVIKQREKFEALQAEVRSRPYVDERGYRFVTCSHPDCDAYPQDRHGAWELVPDRKWWCPQHAHLRGEHDHLPPEPRYRIDPRTMGLEPCGPEPERLKAEHERLQREHEQRAAERRVKHERYAAVRRAREEAMLADLPRGFPRP